VASRTETTRSVSVSEPPLVAETDSLTDLARQVANLRDEISQLRNELSDLRQQFAKGSELGTSGYS
jgi:predicted  nucleic acid-binding Zn-ribbon protein